MSYEAPSAATALADAFRDGVRKCVRLGYTPTYFIRMLEENGAQEAARRLLMSRQVSEGFTRLYNMGHLELTVEAILLRPEFRELFTPKELAVARARLQELGFDDPSAQ